MQTLMQTTSMSPLMINQFKLMEMSSVPVETKPIVGKIGAHISKIKSTSPFIVNKPHNAPEILNYLLNDEMLKSPTYSRDTVVMTTEVSICCQSCF